MAAKQFTAKVEGSITVVGRATKTFVPVGTARETSKGFLVLKFTEAVTIPKGLPVFIFPDKQ